jgi:hypothetical protein
VPKWYYTHIKPSWAGHRDLPYRNEPFNDPESVALWRGLGYTQTRFTGDMYDMREAEPEWMSAVRQQFEWQHFSWSVYRMPPGTVLPNHSDTYARFREIYGITDPDSIWRAVIFLEPWASGHYLEIDGHPYTEWQAGDTVVWQNTVPHLAANVGMTMRYTLQITGTQ